MKLRDEIIADCTLEELEVMFYILDNGYFDFCISRRNVDIAISYLQGEPMTSIAAHYRITSASANAAFKRVYSKVIIRYMAFYLDFLALYNKDWPFDLKHDRLNRLAKEASEYRPELLRYRRTWKNSPLDHFHAQFPQDTTRLANHLYQCGFRNLFELEGRSRAEIQKLCGPKTFEQLEKVLERRGIKLKD